MHRIDCNLDTYQLDEQTIGKLSLKSQHQDSPEPRHAKFELPERSRAREEKTAKK